MNRATVRVQDSRRASRQAAALLAVLCCAAGGRAQPVQGRILSVGFGASGEARHYIRAGQWFPILVELTSVGDQHRTVTLRVEQPDMDGDRVYYTEPSVTLTAGAEPRRVWCYAVSLGQQVSAPLAVELLDEEGARIAPPIDAPLYESISADTRVVLDVSARPVSGLRSIDSGAGAYSEAKYGERRFYQNICVANLAPSDLPDRWFGLEAANVIVWDEPDPDAVSDAQLRAVVEWTRRGGRLVVGIGQNWTKLQRSVLGELMPLEGDGQTLEVDTLPFFFKHFVGPAADEPRFERTIAVATAPLRSNATATFLDQAPGARSVPLISMRHFGSGRVMAVAARIRDLLDARAGERLLAELIDLPRNTPAFNEAESSDIFTILPAALLGVLTEPIDFRRLAGYWVLLAVLFVAAYILASTLASWVWLKKKSLTQLSWSVFAGFAVIASALSLGAVSMTTGLTGRLRSFSLVDMQAGEAEARGLTLFGYVSPSKDSVELQLEGEQAYLRGLSAAARATFATPKRYSDLTADARLTDVPMRATLKQFEGRWRTEIPGGVLGQLTADRASGRVTPDSWVANNFDFDLLGGYLLYIDPRLRARDGAVPYRVASVDQRDDRPLMNHKYLGASSVPPAVNVLVVPIARLQAGEKAAGLFAKEYAATETAWLQWSVSAAGPNPDNEPLLPTLWHVQNGARLGPADFAGANWVGALGRINLTGLEPLYAASLLASTRGLYLPTKRSGFDTFGTPITTGGLVDLDVTHWLAGGARRGQAVLLLVAQEPAPVTLTMDGSPLRASRGAALYRVRLPISYQGDPPSGTPQ